MKVSVVNKTRYAFPKTRARCIVEILEKQLVRATDEVSLAIVGLKEMQGINRTYRGKDEPTDVLAFDYGEILLCPAYIKKKHRIKTKRELIQKIGELFVHGLAHIAGYTHETREKEREMKEVEEKIVRCYYGGKLSEKLKAKSVKVQLKAKKF